MAPPSRSPNFDDALAKAMQQRARPTSRKPDAASLWQQLGHTPHRPPPPAPQQPPPRARPWNHAQKLALGALVRLGAEELTQASSDADLRSAYRQLAKRLHPDRAHAGGDQPHEASSRRFAALARAWSLLHHGPQP